MSDLELYTALPYSIQVVPDSCSDGTQCYRARVVELDGCESHGATPEEALENIEEAKRFYIASMLEDGLKPPFPIAVVTGNSHAQTMVWKVDSGGVPEETDESVLVFSDARVVVPEGVDVSW